MRKFRIVLMDNEIIRTFDWNFIKNALNGTLCLRINRLQQLDVYKTLN